MFICDLLFAFSWCFFRWPRTDLPTQPKLIHCSRSDRMFERDIYWGKRWVCHNCLFSVEYLAYESWLLVLASGWLSQLPGCWNGHKETSCGSSLLSRIPNLSHTFNWRTITVRVLKYEFHCRIFNILHIPKNGTELIHSSYVHCPNDWMHYAVLVIVLVDGLLFVSLPRLWLWLSLLFIHKHPLYVQCYLSATIEWFS